MGGKPPVRTEWTGPETKILDVFICKLRGKLGLACGGESYVETVWGRGYVLREPEGVAQAA